MMSLPTAFIALTLLQGIAALKHSKPRTICKENDYDKDQYCLCPSGQRISVFKSHHKNKKEDRIWQLECAPFQAKLYIPSKD